MPLLDLQSLSDDERYAIRAFRRLAAQVDAIYRPHRHTRFQIRFAHPNRDDEADLIPHDAFRSLAMAVRQTQLKQDATNFDNLLAIAGKVQDANVLALVEEVRRDWKVAFTTRGPLVINGRTYTPGDVLRIYLYADAIHPDREKQHDRLRMKMANPFSSWVLQTTVVEMCRCIRNLDSILAHLFGLEPPPLVDDPAMGLPPYQFD